MGLDYVDIFYSHRFDPDTPLEETMGALDTAVRQGKALYVGHLVLLGRAHPGGGEHPARDWARRCSSTSRPTRCSTAGSRGTCSTCSSEEGVGCIVFSPLAQGLLTDRYLDGIPEGSRASRPAVAFPSEHAQRGEPRARCAALNDIAQRRGQTLAQMALAWALRDPRVTSALIGASSVAQLEENVAALERLDFDADELAEIDGHAQEGEINIWAESSQA